jgi:hypothetical protein
MSTNEHTTPEALGGPMVELDPAERLARMKDTLATPERDHGIDARIIFWLEDRVWGVERTLAKFKARELVARSPYRAWRHDHDGAEEDAREEHNERSHWHVLRHLIAEDGERDGGIRYGLLPALGGLGMYAFTRVQHRLDPRRSHRLNADIEDHAQHEYANLVAEHPEWESLPYRDVVPEYGRYASRADVLRQISRDERAHKERSERLAGER